MTVAFVAPVSISEGERHCLRVDSTICPVYVKAAICDMLSAVKPIDTVRGLEINALGDGLFHLGTYSFSAASPSSHDNPHRRSAAGMGSV
jgi:hypothetical protein